MDFKAALAEMLGEVDGAFGAGLVGTDGLVLDQVSLRPEFDITVAGAEYATVLRNARKASRGFGLSGAAEIMVSTEKAHVLMVPVGESFFAALALAPDGNLGRGRIELKRQAARFGQALV